MSALDDLMALVQNKRAEIKANSGNSLKPMKPPTGKSTWRILPSWRSVGDSNFSHPFAQHFIKDRNGDIKAVFVCDAKTHGKECGVCDTINTAVRSTKDDKILALVNELKSGRSELVNALRMDGTDADPKKPVLLQLPVQSVFDPFLSLWVERMADSINILDLAAGRNIIIEREGSGLNTKYTVKDAAKESAIDSSVMDKLINIDEWIENETRRGLTKSTSIVDNMTHQFLGLTPGSAVARLTASPAVMGMVPASRIIEADEAPITTTIEHVPATPVAVAQVAAAPVVSVVTPKASPVAPAAPDGAMGDAELQALLGQLDG